MIGLISLLYKNVNVDLSTLFLTHFSIFNRLEAFLYILKLYDFSMTYYSAKLSLSECETQCL